MKTIKKLFVPIIGALVLSSCTIITPLAVTENPIGAKRGVSTTTVLFGAIQLNGDFGVADAAKNGKIKGPISTVDLKTTTYIIFEKRELIVTGDAE